MPVETTKVSLASRRMIYLQVLDLCGRSNPGTSKLEGCHNLNSHAIHLQTCIVSKIGTRIHFQYIIGSIGVLSNVEGLHSLLALRSDFVAQSIEFHDVEHRNFGRLIFASSKVDRTAAAFSVAFALVFLCGPP